MKAILSIKSKYADKILNGEKKYELRKKPFKHPVDTVYVYVTRPVKKVTFLFEVGQILCDTPYNLWKTIGTFCGIEKDKFFEYFKNVNYGVAIEIKQVRKLANPFCLKNPPQSWIYVS